MVYLILSWLYPANSFILKGITMANYIEKCENITVPLIPLMGAVFAFPGVPVMIDVSATYLKEAVEYAEKTDSYVFLVTQKNPFCNI